MDFSQVFYCEVVSERALEAAQLSVDYCGDCEGAVDLLVMARCWGRALQLAHRMRRLDLIDEVTSI